MSQRTVVTELPIELWQFAFDIAKIVEPAQKEFLTRTLAGDKEKDIVRELQTKYGINKRQVNAIRSEVKGAISSAKECRKRHIKTLEQQIRSIKSWIKTAKKSLDKIPDACSIRYRQHLRSGKRFIIHQKKRRLHLLEQKLTNLKQQPIKVSLGNKGTQYRTVGATGESKGNQIAQYDGELIAFRVPYALEYKYGKTISAALKFEYLKGQQWIKDAIKANRALSYRIYCKDFRWFIACSTDVPLPNLVSLDKQYGCLGIDINPTVLGWSYIDEDTWLSLRGSPRAVRSDGNLKQHGQIRLNLHSRSTGQIEAALHDATRQLVTLAGQFACPIVIENLDFQNKKSQLREQGKRYARMLSGFTYAFITEQLSQKCELAGIELIQVNPAYSSTIGLVKFMKQYGLSSDTAAAMVLARRGMYLSERIPTQNAYLAVKAGKHVWAAWYVLNNKLKSLKRHQYFALANSQLEVMLFGESKDRLKGKSFDTSFRGENPQGSNRTVTVT